MSVLSMYMVFRAQNLELVDLSGYEQSIHKENQVLFSAGPIESLKTVQDQVSILKGDKTRRQCQVVELAWMEKDRSPQELDGSQLNTVQYKVKPGRLICYISCCYSPYFFPTAAGNGVLSP